MYLQSPDGPALLLFIKYRCASLMHCWAMQTRNCGNASMKTNFRLLSWRANQRVEDFWEGRICLGWACWMDFFRLACMWWAWNCVHPDGPALEGPGWACLYGWTVDLNHGLTCFSLVAMKSFKIKHITHEHEKKRKHNYSSWIHATNVLK